MGREPESTVELERIPDHQLIRPIGKGAYGVVWLAKSILGAFRGVKVIRRKDFSDGRPFEREFNGIKSYEPISRTHPGLVSILQVGRGEGYFYYVMEVADDAGRGQEIDSRSYQPKTLSTLLTRQERMPLRECVRVGRALASALDHLHRHRLVHRDIKPSNIIFVNGQPKFADIGLVTEIGEAATFVGTEGYVPPEGPGHPAADLYGLGKVLYQVATGHTLKQYPDLPDELKREPEAKRFFDVIRRACEPNLRNRFQTGKEMEERLAKVLEPEHALGKEGDSAGSRLRVMVLGNGAGRVGIHLSKFIQDQLLKQGFQVFTDHQWSRGVEGARELEHQVVGADVVVALISEESCRSELLAYELELAMEAGQGGGRPRVILVRLRFDGPLPASLSRVRQAPVTRWSGAFDDERLIADLVSCLRSSDPGVPSTVRLEPVGGAVPLDSKFYIERSADRELRESLAAGESIVLVKGARQMGKTSLLARGLQQARELGLGVILTDLQQFNAASFSSLESFYLALGESIADQLVLDVLPGDVWDSRRSPNTNFERYLRREALERSGSALIWALDEVDRLFTTSFGTEVFGLFRSWHNKRALEPTAPWSKLTLALAYATEAFLFISDLNQSPFNVGVRIGLEDFDPEQVAELNRRHGSPLKTEEELSGFIRLVGGQPFLVRRGLQALVSQEVQVSELERKAEEDEAPFGDHLRRILVSLAKDPVLTGTMRDLLQGRPCPTDERFYRLRASGLVAGTPPDQVRCRCELYERYLRRHLVSSGTG